MVSDCGQGCEQSRMTYWLEVERDRDGLRLRTEMRREQDTYFLEAEKQHGGVRLWTRMRREQDDVLTGGAEGA